MKKSLKAYKLEYLDYLHHFRGYSDLTLQTYDIAITQVLLEAEISEDEINLMPFRLIIASQKSATIAKKLSAIRSFCEYIREQGEEITLLNDDSIKVAKKLPKPVSDEHINEVLKGANELEYLVIMMTYSLGLRISELANVKCTDIKSDWIRVVGKGSKDRDIPIIKELDIKIRHYIEKNSPQTYLFEKSTIKLSENSLRYIITKSFKKIGLKVSPHQLRHSFASTLLNHNARIADVSELLGHSSMATTQIYTKLSNKLKLDNYLKSHPLCKGDDETF